MEGGSRQLRRTRAPSRGGWAALAIAGAWSAAPPYLGPLAGLEVDVDAAVEVVDHVAPGLVAIAAALGALLSRRAAAEALRGMALAGLALLAGLWTTVSHVPLLLDAGTPAAPWDAVLLHASAGPPVLAVAAWLLAHEAGS